MATCFNLACARNGCPVDLASSRSAGNSAHLQGSPKVLRPGLHTLAFPRRRGRHCVDNLGCAHIHGGCGLHHIHLAASVQQQSQLVRDWLHCILFGPTRMRIHHSTRIHICFVSPPPQKRKRKREPMQSCLACELTVQHVCCQPMMTHCHTNLGGPPALSKIRVGQLS